MNPMFKNGGFVVQNGPKWAVRRGNRGDGIYHVWIGLTRSQIRDDTRRKSSDDMC